MPEEETLVPFTVKDFLAKYPELIQNWQNKASKKLLTKEVAEKDFIGASNLLASGQYDPIASKEHIEMMLDFYLQKHELYADIKTDWKNVDSSSVLKQADIDRFPS